MGYNFRPVERDQQFLLPPSLRDWLPEDDLAWLVLDAVDQVDLDPVRARYRSDGWGAPAFDPAMMTALLLYAYAVGERSSRRIERLCRRDIAFRVITANQVPDHATIARFRADHEAALAGLFGEILRLCREAGLGSLGLVAIDGTKIAADAALDANLGADRLDAEIAAILAEAAAADAADDAEDGDRDGGLPAGLANRADRLERLAAARRQLEGPRADASSAPALPAAPSPTGRRRPAARPRLRANTTDPDSRLMHSPRSGAVQAYNAQAAVSEDGLIVAAELTQQPVDVDQLVPMVAAAMAGAARAGLGAIGTVLADGGYWSEANMAGLPPGAPGLLVAPTVGRPRLPGGVPTPRRPRPGRDRMAAVLATQEGARRYRRRQAIVEPVFGQIKEARGIRRFRRRGFTACLAEWRLVCATHNLLKLWRSRVERGPTPPPRRSRSPRRATAPQPA